MPTRVTTGMYAMQIASKQIFLLIVVFVLLFVSMTFTVNAEDSYDQYLHIDCTSISDCVEALVKYVSLKLAAPIAVIFIIYSGFLFVRASGDPAKLQTAKSTLTWTIIGIAVTVAAWTLAVAFKTFFEGL